VRSKGRTGLFSISTSSDFKQDLQLWCSGAVDNETQPDMRKAEAGREQTWWQVMSFGHGTFCGD